MPIIQQQQQHPVLPIPPVPQHHPLSQQPQQSSPLMPGLPQAQVQHMLQPQAQQPPLQQQQQPLVIPEGPLGAIAEQLQGDTADQKLLAALEAILQLQGQVEELRSRNRSLAEDLIRVAQSKPALAATANGGPMANGVHEGPEAAQAEADARVAAQLRASRAEMEAGALK
jgi:FtsZ-binding cell division protein ZapB